MSRVKKIFTRVRDETLTEYPQQTTIHGVKYLANRSSPLAHRIYWIIIFIISFLLLGNFVHKIGRRWLENEVILIDESKPIKVYEIPFPAVTVCPQIKYTKDKFDLLNIPKAELMRSEEPSEYQYKLRVARQLCRREFDSKLIEKLGFAPRFLLRQFNMLDMMQKMSPSFEEQFETCSWINFFAGYATAISSKETCGQLFSMVLTNEGICYTFNSIRDILRTDSLQTDFLYHNITRRHDGWDPEKGYTKANAYPYKGIVKGEFFLTSGLKFVLTANRSDITSVCLSPNIGYKIALHSPTEYPQTYEHFIPLEFGKDYQIAAVPKTIKATEDLRTVTPEERRCYFNDERKLKFYTFYNEHNCRLECYANFLLEDTGRGPFTTPRNSNTTNKDVLLLIKNFGWDFPEFFDIIRSHYEEFGAPRIQGDISFFHKCKCLPECNSIHYGYKIIKINDETTLTKGENDLVQTTIEIIINEPTFIGQQRVRKYTFDTMLSDFGGLLGLFIGGSLLSIFELFYFFVIRNCGKSKLLVQSEN